MYSSILSSILLALSFHFSSIEGSEDAVTAAAVAPDPSTYTVTFKYGEEETSWCLGAVIDNDSVISVSDCFAEPRDDQFFNFTSVKAVVGSREVQVRSVQIAKYTINHRDSRDFAVAKLNESLDLPKSGVELPKKAFGHVDLPGFVSSDEDGNRVDRVKIVDSKNCPSKGGIDFHAESQLCVELPNQDDRCLHQMGSPLVIDVENGFKLIGLKVDCYDDSPYEIFANTAIILHEPNWFNHVYP